MKNCFGLMPGLVYGWPKNILHWQGIEQSIVDIVSTVKPQFAIVDGIVGMEGDGPLMGTAKPVGAIMMSDRLASLDASCAAVMGLAPDRIWYISELARRGFGGASVANIEQRGETIKHSNPASPSSPSSTTSTPDRSVRRSEPRGRPSPGGTPVAAGAPAGRRSPATIIA